MASLLPAMAAAQRSCLLRLMAGRQAVSATARLAGQERLLSLSAVRRVDQPRFDEFTKRRSEFRVPGLTDTRVRERATLDIPAWLLSFLIFILGWYFLTHWQF